MSAFTNIFTVDQPENGADETCQNKENIDLAAERFAKFKNPFENVL